MQEITKPIKEPIAPRTPKSPSEEPIVKEPIVKEPKAKAKDAAPKVASKVASKVAPKAKATPVPKEPKHPSKPQIIIQKIVKEKRAPSAYNKFISEMTKGSKNTFADAIKMWNEQKTK